MVSKKCVVCDCHYDVLKQLVKLNQFLWNCGHYIAGAKKAKNKEAEKVFIQMRADALKNANALRKLVISEAKKGKI